jgi:hypothetical protein
VRVVLAERLHDNESLLALSKEYAAAGDVRAAYGLWIRGGGDQHDAYIGELRQKLLDETSKEKRPNFHFLELKDTVGQRIAYDQLIRVSPVDAYHIALRLDDKQLLEQARQKMVEADPLEALRTAYRRDDRYERPDQRMIELVAQSLAKKYAIPAERVQQHLQRKDEADVSSF